MVDGWLMRPKWGIKRRPQLTSGCSGADWRRRPSSNEEIGGGESGLDRSWRKSPSWTKGFDDRKKADPAKRTTLLGWSGGLGGVGFFNGRGRRLEQGLGAVGILVAGQLWLRGIRLPEEGSPGLVAAWRLRVAGSHDPLAVLHQGNSRSRDRSAFLARTGHVTPWRHPIDPM
jgi:hypothetical protein